MATVIRERRTIYRFKPDPVDPAAIARWIETAVWVPNHHLTEPWRFFVLGPASRRALADIRREATRAKYRDRPQVERVAERDWREYAEAPAVVIVAQAGSDRPERQQEDYAATVLAAYALTLAAWAEGVGSAWATGRLARAPETYALVGLDPDVDRIVAILRFGYPAETPPMRRRPAAELTRTLP
ncbi:MAG: nitroreductase family protein [Actinomycetia bacterium]|nr:nitroreductase family protein [Actinomycetes bacterium]